MSFRILSIDGGGIRGVIAGTMLAEVEQQVGKPAREYFHAIAGNSTGAILAGLLATGRTSLECVELYQRRGSEIFPYRSLLSIKRLGLILQKGLSAPKFSDRGLVQVLQEELRAVTLAELGELKVLMPAYDTISRSPIIFRSWRGDFVNVPLWEAVAASAVGPTKFPARRLEVNGRVYSAIDGGVGANNPSGLALAEALKLGHSLSDITVLSLGNGENTRPISLKQAQSWGAAQWAIPITSVLQDASSDFQASITEEVVGSPRYLRLQFKLDRDLTGKVLNDDSDDATPENISNLIEAAQVYIKKPEIQKSLANFLAANP